jgi:polyisoprenyl-teichoic acid--peptidoglycan teichoic acid transferase
VRNQLLMVLGIVALAAGAFYTALIVVTQVDHIFFPDSEIRIAGLPGVNGLPGVDAKGTSGEVSAAGDQGGRRINILVMGLDKRDRDGDLPSRTDTMFVLTIDPVSDTARGLAMPRDLWVEIPIDDTPGNVTENRINAAYVLGENDDDFEGGGIGTVRRTVEHLLGIEIDHHVLIDFEGFREVVNLLGGIDVVVPEPGVNDPEYSETELPGDYFPCVFPPGEYHMDGSQALCYARVRRGSDDLDRIARQQYVIFAMIRKAAQLDFLNSPDALVNLWRQYKDTVQTDVGDLQAPGYAKMAANINENSLSFLTLGVVATPFTTSEGAQVLLPSPEGVRQLVDAFLSDSRLLAENATVEVQNATATPELAIQATDYLVSLGLPPSNIAASDVTATALATEIVVFTDKNYTAERIAGWLGISTESIRVATPADEALRTTASDILILVADDARIEDVPSAGGAAP